jgi:hypothetical protein
MNPNLSRVAVRVLALFVVALIIGVCLLTSVEASSSVHHECNALTDGQKILSKPSLSSPGLVIIPTEAAHLVVPSGVVRQAPSHALRLASAASSDGPPARSPPASR